MAAQAELLPFAASDRPGFRLQRLEVLNWGTFHQRVWKLEPGGVDLLLTGDIGSGKSTLVDALTTLLVAPRKLAYNRAVGAETRERSLRSYVLGYYKSVRDEEGSGGKAAKKVSLRGVSSYSVILEHFRSDDLNQDLTLAQLFWFREPVGQSARFYMVAERALSTLEHFAGFGSDVARLKKRLRRLGAEVFDSFPSYAAASASPRNRPWSCFIRPYRCSRWATSPISSAATCSSLSRWSAVSRPSSAISTT